MKTVLYSLVHVRLHVKVPDSLCRWLLRKVVQIFCSVLQSSQIQYLQYPVTVI